MAAQVNRRMMILIGPCFCRSTCIEDQYVIRTVLEISSVGYTGITCRHKPRCSKV